MGISAEQLTAAVYFFENKILLIFYQEKNTKDRFLGKLSFFRSVRQAAPYISTFVRRYESSCEAADSIFLLLQKLQDTKLSAEPGRLGIHCAGASSFR